MMITDMEYNPPQADPNAWQGGMNSGGNWASMPSGGTMDPETIKQSILAGGNPDNMPGATTNGRAYTQSGQAQPTSFIDDLFGVGKGVYDARQNKDFSNNMKQFYGDALARQDPIRQRLMESYTNPNSFYDSNEYKGLASIYQNSVDRGAAKGGTLANPTAREVLLQQHALKSMNDYRSGLTQQMQALDPGKYAEAWAKGTEAERMANMPVGSAAQNFLRNAGGIEGIMRMAQQIPGGINSMIQQIPGLAGIFQNIFGGGSDPTTGAPSMGSYGEGWGDEGWDMGGGQNDDGSWGYMPEEGGYNPSEIYSPTGETWEAWSPEDYGGYTDPYGGYGDISQTYPEFEGFGDMGDWFDF